MRTGHTPITVGVHHAHAHAHVHVHVCACLHVHVHVVHVHTYTCTCTCFMHICIAYAHATFMQTGNVQRAPPCSRRERLYGLQVAKRHLQQHCKVGISRRILFSSSSIDVSLQMVPAVLEARKKNRDTCA